MSYLATALDTAIRADGSTQTALAAAAGITQSQVNRAARGRVRVKTNTIHAIAAALPAEHRGAVVAAWLKDQLRPELLATVEILAAGHPSTGPVPAPALPIELDPDTRDLLIWLAGQAVRHTAVRDALHSLRAATQALTS